MDESDLEYLLTHCMGCHESLIDGRDLDSEGLPLYGCGVCGDRLCRDCDARYGVCSAYECELTVDIP